LLRALLVAEIPRVDRERADPGEGDERERDERQHLSAVCRARGSREGRFEMHEFPPSQR
jgi:hypothetical protein